MKATRHSSTAEATAAVRAWHRLNHSPLIFDDPYAFEFTSKIWRGICRNRLLTWLIFERALRPLQPVAAEIICRARYTEDKLESAIQNGVTQYVLMGAGFDSFALRRPELAEHIRIYEVDHPLSQRVKKERIDRQHGRMPLNVEFVPVDFEKETLPHALKDSGYDNLRPAFFSWLGVVQYLPSQSVFETLESLASLTMPGSELVFDYLLPEDELGRADKKVLERLRSFTKRRDEPLASSFSPSEMEHEVSRRGFEVIENLSPAEQESRYFSGQNNNLRPFGGYYIIHLRRTA